MVDAAARGLTYVDPVAAKEFEAATGNFFEIVQVVNAPVDNVFDDWLQKIWIGKYKIASPGVGRGLVGNERVIDAFNVVEKIVAAGVPTSDNSQIATINYAVTTFGKFPWTHHAGFVQFVPTDGGKQTTLVVGSKTTPKKNADGTPFDDSKLRAVLKKAIASQLTSLAASYPSSTASKL